MGGKTLTADIKFSWDDDPPNNPSWQNSLFIRITLIRE